MAKLMVKMALIIFIFLVLSFHTVLSSDGNDSDNQPEVNNNSTDYVSWALGRLIDKKPSFVPCIAKLVKANPAIIRPERSDDAVFVPKIFVDVTLGIMRKRHGEPWFQKHFCDFYKIEQ